MPRPYLQLLSVLALASFAPVVRAQPVTYQLNLSGAYTVTGTVTFSAAPASDGTFNFDSAGSPIASTQLTFYTGAPTYTDVEVSLPRPAGSYRLSSSGGLEGTFLLPTSAADGLHAFGEGGVPLSSPSFTHGSSILSNPPNGNDRYLITGGVVTALKYDFYSGFTEAQLRTDGTYAVQQDFTEVESGTYTLTSIAGSLYTTTVQVATPSNTNPVNFTNAPNQNDRYVVSGGRITALKYDLYQGAYGLNLGADGSYTLDSNFATVAIGSYTLTAVPEPAAFSLWLGLIVAGCSAVRRRARAG